MNILVLHLCRRKIDHFVSSIFWMIFLKKRLSPVNAFKHFQKIDCFCLFFLLKKNTGSNLGSQSKSVIVIRFKTRPKGGKFLAHSVSPILGQSPLFFEIGSQSPLFQSPLSRRGRRNYARVCARGSELGIRNL